MAKKSGLSEFMSVIGDVRQVSSIAVKGVILFPLIDMWTKIGVPPTSQIALLSAIVQLVVVMWVFSFWSDLDADQLKRKLRISLVSFLLMFVCLFCLIQTFTVARGKGIDRVVTGYQVRPEIEDIINKHIDVNIGSPEEALRSSEYKAEDVWTKSSVTVMQIVLPVLSVTTFALLAVSITAFTISLRKSKR